MRAKNVVLVYRSQLLPISETFIREQVLAYRRWRPILVGQELGPLPVDDVDCRLLGPQHGGLVIRAFRKFGLVRRESIATIAQSPLRYAKPDVIRQLKQENASLLHVHFGVDALVAWPLARELGLPMLVTLHGYDIRIHREWWEQGRGGEFMREYPAQLLALAKQKDIHFVAVSDSILQCAVRFGIPANKILTHYIGVDPQKFTPGGLPVSKRKRRVLFVGRLVEKKGCIFLIKAMAAVQQSVPNASLVVIGDGPLRKELEEQAQQLSVDVQFRGAQPPYEVKRELDRSRVFCLPSITAHSGDAEGLGIVILEAQASGVPVVTSAAGGAQEGIEEGRTGFAFKEADAETLTKRLKMLLTNDELADRFAERAPHFIAERFNIHSCTAALEQLYDGLIHNGIC